MPSYELWIDVVTAFTHLEKETASPHFQNIQEYIWHAHKNFLIDFILYIINERGVVCLATIKAGDCVGILYFTTMGAPATVHDGVLVSPNSLNSKTYNGPVTILHYNINRKTGHLYRQLITVTPIEIRKTPFNKSDQKGRCKSVIPSPSIPAASCVAVKFRVTPSSAFPAGREVKNGRLLCPIKTGNNPPDEVWIYHWLVKNPNSDSPSLKLDLKKYTGVTYVEKARVFPLPKSRIRTTRLLKRRMGDHCNRT